MPSGIELSFWAATERGPLRIAVPQQQAVCFIDRQQEWPLPTGAQRKPVALRVAGGAEVDAIYLRRQRQLADLHKAADGLLYESDVKPAERYLSERFINAGFVASGVISQADGYLQLVNPRWSKSSYKPTLRLASIDIETEGLDGRLYSIAIDCDGSALVLMIGEPQSAPADCDFELQWCADESALLEAFFSALVTLDPDVLIGWNVVNFDLDFIERRCRRLGLVFDPGRGTDASIILQPGSVGHQVIARVPGRAVVDGIDTLRAAFWSFESFSLEFVARSLLGAGKTIATGQRVDEINRLFREDKIALARYNIQDCRLVTEIFAAAELTDFAIQRAQMTGLPMDKTGGSVQTLDNLYLPLMHRQGYVAPFGRGSSGAGSPGGYVLDSEPGLYRNVIVLDFKSLYPSIIRTFLIDPLGMAVVQPGDDAVPGFEGASFSRQTHILPGLIEGLWEQRDEAKRNCNQPLSQAIKIIMNSFYGVLGSSGCRFHDQRLASSITRRGHEIILTSKERIEQAGYRVIYGDTDSLFVLIGEQHSEAAVADIGEQLQRDLNTFWTHDLQQRFSLQSCLEVEFETHFLRFFMPTVRGSESGSKKRYAGMVRENNGKAPRLMFKGLEAARTDWTPLARELQRELFQLIFNDQPYKALLQETHRRLFAGELDNKLIYRKSLRRKLSEYQRNVPPHVQAARKMSVVPGRRVEYVITLSGPEPASELNSRPDYQHYVERQLAPAADGILQFEGTSYEAVCSTQEVLF